jgi:hypothetical protein
VAVPFAFRWLRRGGWAVRTTATQPASCVLHDVASAVLGAFLNRFEKTDTDDFGIAAISAWYSLPGKAVEWQRRRQALSRRPKCSRRPAASMATPAPADLDRPPSSSKFSGPGAVRPVAGIRPLGAAEILTCYRHSWGAAEVCLDRPDRRPMQNGIASRPSGRSR